MSVFGCLKVYELPRYVIIPQLYKAAGKRFETSLNRDICTKQVLFVQLLKKLKYCNISYFKAME